MVSYSWSDICFVRAAGIISFISRNEKKVKISLKLNNKVKGATYFAPFIVIIGIN